MCGIFGVTHNKQAAYLTYLGLHALQHRGQEACGIVSADAEHCRQELAKGLVDEGIQAASLARLKGDFSIGHVRYSTAGGSLMRNTQPLVAFNTPLGEIALAHNGNIPGYKGLRSQLQKQGALFYTDSDSEVLLVAIVGALQRQSNGDRHIGVAQFAKILTEALSGIEGAYSLLILTRDFMVAVRDPWGMRPLVMGRLDGSYVFASETGAFDLIGARYQREVKPGEIVIVSRVKAVPQSYPLKAERRAACVFELVYFAKPDGKVFDKEVYLARRRMGARLAEEAPVKGADLVIAVPDSATVQALGFAQKAGLPFESALIRSHYIGRTFIAPEQKIRDFSTKLKFNPVRGMLKGKKVVVVDDSIVRGTTSKKIIRLLKEVGGAKEVHMRIASPPIAWPCFYGIDMPTRRELIAANRKVESIRRYLNVASLAYLSLDGMLDAAADGQDGFCHACFSGQYTVAKDAVQRSLQA
ncbi:MAG: amidophosphoribosyltransferase [Elusimicrobiota bacterium]